VNMHINFWALSQFNLAGVNCLYTVLIKLLMLWVQA
jgi:hypothetical protein